MWLGRPLGEAVVFAAVAAGGREEGSHIHLRRAGGQAWAWSSGGAGSFCCRRDRAHRRGSLLGCENRADFMAFSRGAGEKSLFPVFVSELGFRASKCLSRNSHKAGWRK